MEDSSLKIAWVTSSASTVRVTSSAVKAGEPLALQINFEVSGTVEKFNLRKV